MPKMRVVSLVQSWWVPNSQLSVFITSDQLPKSSLITLFYITNYKLILFKWHFRVTGSLGVILTPEPALNYHVEWVSTASVQQGAAVLSGFRESGPPHAHHRAMFQDLVIWNPTLSLRCTGRGGGWGQLMLKTPLFFLLGEKRAWKK